MQTTEELQKDSLLEKIASCSVSDALSAGDDRLAAIRGFESVFKQVSRTPSVIRMLLHKEFHFEGQVDASTKSQEFTEEKLLSSPWYKSTFVVPNFSNMVDWSQRFALESEKGNTVVAIIPARTNTNWFHEFVLSKAAEIRFIKGRLTFPGYKSQSPFPDIVAIYVPACQRRKVRSSILPQPQSVDITQNNRSRLAIVASFTGDEEVEIESFEKEKLGAESSLEPRDPGPKSKIYENKKKNKN